MSRYPAASDVSRAGLVLAAALVLGSCSLGTVDYANCRDDGECRVAFGLGYTCGDGGLCEQTGLHPRCQPAPGEPSPDVNDVFQTFPTDLLTSDEYRDALVVGTIIDATSVTHRGRARAVKLAVNEANASGGLAGRPIGVVVCSNEVNGSRDDLDQAQASAEVAQYLSRSLGAPAIVGPPSSGATEAAFAALDGMDTVLISPSATSPRLTALEPDATDEAPGRLWRTAPPDSNQGPAIAEDMRARGVAKLAIIFQEGSYGGGLSDVVVESFADASHDARPLMFSNPIQISSRLADVDAEGGFDEILFISSQPDDIVDFLVQVHRITSFADVSVFLTDSAANADVLDEARSFEGLLPRLRGSRPAPVQGIVYDGFLGRFEATFGTFGMEPEQISFGAHAYDAAWIALYGAGWAHFQEDGIGGLTIARGMRRLSSGNRTTINAGTYPDVLDAFRTARSLDVEGASGSLDFDPVTEETSAPVDIWAIAEQSGSFVLVDAAAP